MENKIYRLYGVDAAMNLLRPGAKWEIYNNRIVKWNDPRPCPTWQEIEETMQKILDFENSIPTIWTDEQIGKLQEQHKKYEESVK